ncbi:hypothetical protein D1AOALGA4SA_12770 [Olavius algarvensis Delta 1 endosymbiont]|nr:hypothetical protein D1AOALGA4SA_12770 [Olavius algarvensis Delta 1 endosymbiont]
MTKVERFWVQRFWVQRLIKTVNRRISKTGFALASQALSLLASLCFIKLIEYNQPLNLEL